MILGKRYRNKGLLFLSPLLVLGVMTRLMGAVVKQPSRRRSVLWVVSTERWKDLISDDTVKPRYEVTWELIS